MLHRSVTGDPRKREDHRFCFKSVAVVFINKNND